MFKISTQAAVVICVGVVTVAALVYGLAVYAQMDDGALIGLATAAGAILGNLLVQLRSNAKLADQDRTLDRIVTQTNGKSDDEIRRIAVEALEQAKSRGLL